MSNLDSPNNIIDNPNSTEVPTPPPSTPSSKLAGYRRALYLGMAVGASLPVVMIVVKIIICRYGLGDLGDVFSAFGWCALPPALAGAGITAAAVSIGKAADRRAGARQSGIASNTRGEMTGLWIGLVISFLLGAVPALMVLFPDC